MRSQVRPRKVKKARVKKKKKAVTIHH